MISPTLNIRTNTLRIEFAKEAKVKTESHHVNSIEHASRLLHIRTKSYLVDKLSKYANQRLHALGNRATMQQQYALGRIRYVVLNYYERPLPYLALKIKQLKEDLEVIAPSRLSRFYNHYAKVIVPAVQWCEEYHDKHFGHKNYS